MNMAVCWDTSAIAEAHAEYLMEEGDFEGTKDEALERAHGDTVLFTHEWETLLEAFTLWMDGRTQWHAEGRQMGWRNLAGYKDFEAKDGQALLQAVLPKTNEFVLKGETDDEGVLHLRVWHHDSPVNPDTFEIREDPEEE